MYSLQSILGVTDNESCRQLHLASVFFFSLFLITYLGFKHENQALQVMLTEVPITVQIDSVNHSCLF